jgi:hypothetical protein
VSARIDAVAVKILTGPYRIGSSSERYCPAGMMSSATPQEVKIAEERS